VTLPMPVMTTRRFMVRSHPQQRYFTAENAESAEKNNQDFKYISACCSPIFAVLCVLRASAVKSS